MAAWKTALALFGSYGASAARLGFGIRVGDLGPRPEQALELYEFEACPYCRRVREALTVLDLDAVIRPCPRGGTVYRPAQKRRGSGLFPFLVDPNTGVEMEESADIVAYLFSQYGAGPVPAMLRGPLSVLSSSMASAARATSGRIAHPSTPPAEPLELFGFEGSPYVRLVRETLCSLELTYVSRTVGKNSPGRPAFVQRAGKMQVPFLVDPNTGVEMFESADIVNYLAQTYAAS